MDLSILFNVGNPLGKSKHTKETSVKRLDEARSKYLSIIIPIYNEEENIPLLHERLHNVLKQQDFSYEVIYIDDGSKDASFAQLCRLLDHDDTVHIIQFRRNFGQTAAIAAGVAHSQGEVLIFMDGDLQNDPIDIPHLLAKIGEGYDVVSGWRKDHKDAHWTRKIPSQIANALISKVTGIHLHDYSCTLKACRYEIFHHIRLYGEMHRFIPAYAALSGAAITEIPVEHHPRQFGRSKYGISSIVPVLCDLATFKFLGSYGTRPLYAFGLIGLPSLGLGVGTTLFALVRRLIPVPTGKRRTPLLPRATLLTGFGILSIMLGLLAEMLTRIYYESQDKTIYTIQQIRSKSESAAKTTSDSAQNTALTTGTASTTQRTNSVPGAKHFQNISKNRQRKQRENVS
jgi:glycosyltransferase involved in cell wall biosynthesis